MPTAVMTSYPSRHRARAPRALARTAVVIAAAIATSPTLARAQDGDGQPAQVVRAHAHRRTSAITVDGVIDEAEWLGCPPVTGFVQRFPDAGKAPTEPTEFRVSYDDTAIYVAVRALDDHADKIQGLLTRRDKDSSSDWIMLGIDSYHDRRTAFVFGVNPAGVQRDMIIYDDSQVDDSWDAVWTAKTSVDDKGWTAEFRIPLSQLRFSPKDTPSWGFQVERVVQRTGEESVWSPWPRSTQRVVSRFGALDGLGDLAPARRLELLPYVTGGGDLQESLDPADPFGKTARPRGNAGLDVRLGLGSAFTLAATINPDFGQVEADPSQVNLTANELYFAEKRPFFLDGTDIFQFSLNQGDGPTSGDTLFYSRRIGGAPHADLSGYSYTDAPTATTIYGAAKVSGKTPGGWSLGLLDAITSEETARVADASGAQSRPVVEPLTNYALGRVKKDLRDGGTTVGGEVTAVNRVLAGTGLEATLHDQAYAGGLQLQHRFADDTWDLGLRLAGSWVHGTTDAIAATQQLVRHDYQRPDQHHVHFDPTRTSLAGAAAILELGKFTTGHWHYGIGADSRTPGFEVNDLGLQRTADYGSGWGMFEYRDDDPGKHVLEWNAGINAWTFASLEPQVTDIGLGPNVHVTLSNHWDLGAGLETNDNTWDTTALRGGPELRGDRAYNLWTFVSTDPRKRVSASFNVVGGVRPAVHNTGLQAGGTITVQARSNVDLALGPTLLLKTDDNQYVDQIVDTTGTTRYVFGRVHEVVTALTIRANWTFSPHLSLQLYAEPFVATGRYTGLKEAADTHSADPAARFHVFGAGHQLVTGDTVMVDRDGNGSYDYSFGVPDFTALQMRSTAVLRWEYRPGSALFLIWSHDGEGSTTDGLYRFGGDFSALARQPGTDVVMAKLNYWIGV